MLIRRWTVLLRQHTVEIAVFEASTPARARIHFALVHQRNGDSLSLLTTRPAVGLSVATVAGFFYGVATGVGNVLVETPLLPLRKRLKSIGETRVGDFTRSFRVENFDRFAGNLNLCVLGHLLTSQRDRSPLLQHLKLIVGLPLSTTCSSPMHAVRITRGLWRGGRRSRGGGRRRKD